MIGDDNYLPVIGLLQTMILHITSADNNAPRAKSAGVIIFPSSENTLDKAIVYTPIGNRIKIHSPAMFKGILKGRFSCGSFIRKIIRLINSRNKAAPYKVTSIINRSPNVHSIMPLTTKAQAIIDIYGVLNLRCSS